MLCISAAQFGVCTTSPGRDSGHNDEDRDVDWVGNFTLRRTAILKTSAGRGGWSRPPVRPVVVVSSYESVGGRRARKKIIAEAGGSMTAGRQGTPDDVSSERAVTAQLQDKEIRPPPPSPNWPPIMRILRACGRRLRR